MRKLEVEQFPAEVTDHGSYPARECRTLTWTGEFDGRKYELRAILRPRPYLIGLGRNANPYARTHMSSSDVEWRKKPRLYVSFPGESLLDNLVNRTSRPAASLGRLVRPLLKHLDMGGTIGWYAKAGCSMCPCSPGFIWTDAPRLNFGRLDERGMESARYDAYLDLQDVPTVKDEPETLLRQDQRLAALAADPTLDLAALANTKL